MIELQPVAETAVSDIDEPGITRKTGRTVPKSAFRPGQSGNPSGRPKRTQAEFELIAACESKAPEALAVIEHLMLHAKQETVRMAAATFVIERRYGKPTERKEVVMSAVQRLTDDELDRLIALKSMEAGMVVATKLLQHE